MSTKQQILQKLLASPHYISGETLASQLHITRNSVWKAIHALRHDGYIIDSHKYYGYKLVHSPQSIDATLLTSALPYTVFIYDTVDSTNLQAKLYAEKHPQEDIAIFVAQQQTHGRGRFGRVFYSPKNTGIYLSLLYRSTKINAHLHLITPLCAVAVHRAIYKTTGITVGIKWINDLFLNQKKICGILTESVVNIESNTVDYIVIGMGINLFQNPTLPSELSEIIGYLTDEAIDINWLVLEIITELLDLLYQLPNTHFLTEYKQHCFILNHPITVYPKSNNSYHAIALDITQNGELMVQKKDGTTHILHYGEVSTRLTKGDNL